ncbi:MAG: MBL fold metallo-hydrolase [Proteobacteria bacterium]|nr:MBL fold metallo-hydrolase [Pseudomonadota bacterium]
MIKVQDFFDPETYTLSYIVYDVQSRDTVIIDPVLNWNIGSGKIYHKSVEKLIAFAREASLKVRMILETHAHADHLSGSQELKRVFPDARLAIGSRITEVQALFKNVYNFPSSFATDGRQFDQLLHDGETIKVGSLSFLVINTPGHTPACCSYQFRNKVFTGDTLFMPDYGTGRCDFPGGSAAELFKSIKERLYTLPDATEFFTGHDYQPGGRPLLFRSTIGESKSSNIQLNARTTAEEFLQFRQARDASLDAPKLLHPSVQVNIDAGHLPGPEDNGIAYLRIPLTIK